MSEFRVSIYLGVLGEKVITVEATYNKYYPATYEEPEEGGDFDIESVCLGDLDITDLITEEGWDEIHEILANWSED